MYHISHENHSTLKRARAGGKAEWPMYGIYKQYLTKYPQSWGGEREEEMQKNPNPILVYCSLWWHGPSNSETVLDLLKIWTNSKSVALVEARVFTMKEGNTNLECWKARKNTLGMGTRSIGVKSRFLKYTYVYFRSLCAHIYEYMYMYVCILIYI